MITRTHGSKKRATDLRSRPLKMPISRVQEFDPLARAFENARGIVLAITHANFVVARWCCGSDLRVTFAAILTMTRCDHRVDKSLSVVTSITTHALQHCA